MSTAMDVTLTYVGGPTALIELAGLRLLTDPTFDPADRDYPRAGYTLHKTQPPALSAADLLPVDAVLLSHDHHADNLDDAGRAMLARTPRVLTTRAGADRLGGNAIGLAAGDRVVLGGPTGGLRITATPARHGPAGGDRGPVIGFLLEPVDAAQARVYVSGDTVWYDEVAALARQKHVAVALLFMGAARVAAAGPSHLTFTAEEAAQAARAFAGATIVPLHYEGWTHFSESRADVEQAFRAAGVAHRLRFLAPGAPTTLPLLREVAAA